jgi:hypothetical protein
MTSSLRRPRLKILLSFAQCEREIVSERIGACATSVTNTCPENIP